GSAEVEVELGGGEVDAGEADRPDAAEIEQRVDARVGDVDLRGGDADQRHVVAAGDEVGDRRVHPLVEGEGVAAAAAGERDRAGGVVDEHVAARPADQRAGGEAVDLELVAAVAAVEPGGVGAVAGEGDRVVAEAGGDLGQVVAERVAVAGDGHGVVAVA